MAAAALLPAVLSGVQFFGGMNTARRAQAAQMQAYMQGAQALASLVPPDLMSVMEPYKEMVFRGELTPSEFVATLQEQSQLNNIEVPQQLIDQQYNVLAQLGEVAEKGLTDIDKARLNDLRDQQIAAERGNREAILMESQRRGTGGSGAELASRMLSQQEGANRAAKAGTDIAAEAQRRALEAMITGGQMAGQVRGQEFSEQARQAEAQDAINRFNVEMANRARAANVDAINRAREIARQQEYDVQRANINTQIAEQQARMGALQQGWANRFNQTSAVAGRSAQVGDALGQQAQMARMQAGLAGGEFGRSLPGAIDAAKPALNTATDWLKDKFRTTPAPGSQNMVLFSDEDVKKDIHEVASDEIEDILDKLTGYKYKYDKSKMENLPSGSHIGIMAQDMEKEAPGMVVEVEGVKGIDKDKAISLALAALADVNKRLKKVETK